MVNGNYLGMTEGKTAALVYIITVGFKKKKPNQSDDAVFNKGTVAI